MLNYLTNFYSYQLYILISSIFSEQIINILKSNDIILWIYALEFQINILFTIVISEDFIILIDLSPPAVKRSLLILVKLNYISSNTNLILQILLFIYHTIIDLSKDADTNLLLLIFNKS